MVNKAPQTLPFAMALPIIQAPMAGVQGLEAGGSDFSPLWAGQNAWQGSPRSAAQVTRELAGV